MRGFSLIEAMVAMALAGVLAATVLATFAGAQQEQGSSKQDWAMFTIAQQQMELLASLPPDASLLSPSVPATPAPGTDPDRTCADVAVGPQHFRVNSFGDPLAGGPFDVCYRVTAGHPAGALKNIRVVVTPASGGQRAVLLQTIR